MTDFHQTLFLVASFMGGLLGFALITRIFNKNKGDFFLGLVVLTLAIELFFSWGSLSGFNNNPGVFPYWMFLNYLLLPPGIWLFVKYHMDDNFQFHPKHLWLFLPAVLAYILDVWSTVNSVSLIEYTAWTWFTQYLPLLGLIYVLGYFWIKYFQLMQRHGLKFHKNSFLSQLRLLMLMACLTIVCLLWLIFEFVGFRYYELIEYTAILLFMGFAFFIFLESQTFTPLALEAKNREFPNYDDQQNLVLLEQTINKNRSYLKPSFPLKELSRELDLPARYVSFLINHYHGKNYREFINQYRIDAFLEKAASGENEVKTLLGLALESGFNSKSTFNKVFKDHMGKSPSEYLNQYQS
ncbi:AraC family transcriptional regulator [Robiginitalea sp. SC105]|uniref:helix-turn-helix domain-containing protein n=1 Tax=Robiginitalea sp. SC105 TaxID=2762332 RepID=UPI00163AF5C0|nr:helix-turn-helix domain-containing protein [Robiginitalea sp. SC105]MBC2838346.1 AraC family transcriptional regulator [Robiginitalea sp. SC105]